MNDGIFHQNCTFVRGSRDQAASSVTLLHLLESRALTTRRHVELKNPKVDKRPWLSAKEIHSILSFFWDELVPVQKAIDLKARDLFELMVETRNAETTSLEVPRPSLNSAFNTCDYLSPKTIEQVHTYNSEVQSMMTGIELSVLGEYS
jgi:hypothetical protein